MLMTALVAAGLALFVAFVCRSLVPAPWGRRLFLIFGVPSLGLVALGLGATVYFYIRCEQVEIARRFNADQSVVATISAVDCGAPDARTFDVSVSLAAGEKTVDQTVLRSRGRPAPVEVAFTDARSLRVTLEDGRSFDSTLIGDKGQPDKVWSIIDGKVMP